MNPRWRIALGVGAAAVSILGWVRLLLLAPHDTGAHRFAEVEPESTGCGGTVQVSALVMGNTLWVWCDDHLARLYPEEGRVQRKWPLPRGQEMTFMHLLMPGPGQQIAMLYEDRNRFYTAVAGAEGWSVPPKRVEDLAPGKVLGMGWHQGEVEIAYSPASDSDRYGRRTEVRAASLKTPQKFRSFHNPCAENEDFGCELLAAYRQGADWHVLQMKREEHVLRLFDLSADGRSARELELDPEIELLGREVSFLSAGQVVSDAGRYVHRPGGLQVAEEPPESIKNGYLSRGSYRVSAELGLEAQLIYERQGHPKEPQRLSLVHRIDGSWAELSHDEVETLLLRDLDAPKPSWRPIGRVPSFAGANLASDGVFVPRRAGGWWVIDPEDWYFIALDAELERSEGLPLEEHLGRRGSHGHPDRRESHHQYLLLWLLLGPVLIVLIYWGGGSSEKWFRFQATLAGAYVLSGSTCLALLWNFF